MLPGTSTPAYGHPYGQTTATVEEMNRREIVLGARSRSCGQWDIWEAVFGPQGADNYPERIWCKDPAAGCESASEIQTRNLLASRASPADQEIDASDLATGTAR